MRVRPQGLGVQKKISIFSEFPQPRVRFGLVVNFEHRRNDWIGGVPPVRLLLKPFMQPTERVNVLGRPDLPSGNRRQKVACARHFDQHRVKRQVKVLTGNVLKSAELLIALQTGDELQIVLVRSVSQADARGVQRVRYILSEKDVGFVSGSARQPRSCSMCQRPDA